MPISKDATSSINTGSSGTSQSWSHTCSGSNRYLLVAVATNGGGSDATGATYAGANMTALGSQQEGDTGYRISLWGLVNPASGTNTITVSWNEDHAVECCAISFTNVSQSAPTGTVALAQTQSSVAITKTVGAFTDSLVVDAVAWNQGALPANESAGPQQTHRVGGSGSFARCSISTESGSATITMSHGFDTSTNAALAVLPLQVASAAPPPPPPSSGSVSVDTTSTINSGGSGTSLSWTHTCTGANGYLLVGMGVNGGGSDVLSISYAGSPLSLLVGKQEGPTGYRASLWGKYGPASGVNVVVATFAESHAIEAKAISFAGVDPVSSVASSVFSAETAAASIGRSLSAFATNSKVVDFVVWNQSGTPGTESVGPQQTKRGGAAAGAFTRAALSTESGSATISMTWGFNASVNLAYVGVAVQPASVSSPPPPPPAAYGAYPIWDSATLTPNSTATTAMVATRVSTFSAGDLFLVFLNWATASETINAVPSGWTLVRTATQGTANDISSACYYHIASAGEATTYTWGMTGTGVQNSILFIRVTNAHPTTPIDTSSGNGGTGSGAQSGAMTTAYNNELVIYNVALRSSAGGLVFTPPASYTTAYSSLQSGVCNAWGAIANYAGFGAISALNSTLTNAGTTDPWAVLHVAIRPPDVTASPAQPGSVQLPLPHKFYTRRNWPTVFTGWLTLDPGSVPLVPIPPTAWSGLPELFYRKRRDKFWQQNFQQPPVGPDNLNAPPPPPPPSPPPPPPPPPGNPGIGSERNERFRVSLPPQELADYPQWQRQAAAWMMEINLGHLQNTGEVTLAANQNTTVVLDSRAGPNSVIEFMPTTSDAAAELGSGTMFVAYQTNGRFDITHSNSASTTRTFQYAILG